MSRIHPITNMPLEDGRGALPDDQQALVLHCAYLEQVHGKEHADEIRARITRSANGAAREPEPSAHEPPAPDNATLVARVAYLENELAKAEKYAADAQENARAVDEANKGLSATVAQLEAELAAAKAAEKPKLTVVESQHGDEQP